MPKNRNHIKVDTDLLKKYNESADGRTLLFALSGGTDSVPLFHFLRTAFPEHFRKMIGVFVHHGTDESNDGYDLLRRKYSDWPIIYTEISSAERDPDKDSLESFWRKQRYDILIDCLQSLKTVTGSDNVACITGHHQNDDAETFLMSFLSSGDPKYINEEIVMYHSEGTKFGIFIRPFLYTPKDTIESWANNKCCWGAPQYSGDDMRSRLRADVMENLLDLYPGFIKIPGKERKSNKYMAKFWADHPRNHPNSGF